MERRHRVSKRYAMVRPNPRSWELGTLEEVTGYQVWEMTQSFTVAGRTDAKPPRRTLAVLTELFPAVPREDFLLHSQIFVQDGRASVGDAVIFNTGGCSGVGELPLHAI